MNPHFLLIKIHDSHYSFFIRKNYFFIIGFGPMDPCQCHWSFVQTIASQYGMDCAPTLYYHSIRKITIKKLKMKKKKEEEEEENLFPLDLNK